MTRWMTRWLVCHALWNPNHRRGEKSTALDDKELIILVTQVRQPLHANHGSKLGKHLKLRTPTSKEKKHRTSCSKNSYQQKYKNRQFLWEIIIITMIKVQKECNKVSSSKNTSCLNPRNDGWSYRKMVSWCWWLHKRQRPNFPRPNDIRRLKINSAKLRWQTGFLDIYLACIRLLTMQN